MENTLSSFIVYGEPLAWKRPRFNGKSKHVYEDPKVREYKKKVIEAFEESGGKVFEKDVPLKMIVDVYIGVPKSASFKKQYGLIANGRPTKRPDIDNIYKLIADALNKVAYYDDSQIVSVTLCKLWSTEPRVRIELREIRTEYE